MILGPKGSASLPSSLSFNMFCLDAVKEPGTDLTCHDDNWHIKVVAGVPEEDSSKVHILHAKSNADMGSIPVSSGIEHSMTNDHINQNHCPPNVI